MRYQVKSIPAEIKDLSVHDRTVTGYFASFTDSFDYDMDIIAPTAGNKTIAEWGPEGKNKIMHLYQHKTEMPLAKPKVLRADNFGIYFESQFAKTSYGDDVLKLYEAGVINEHSFGFEVLRSEPVTIGGVGGNRITEFRMWEGSTVTFGANEDTPFMGFKNMDKPEILENITRLTKAVRSGTFTDETFHLLEIRLAQLHSAIEKHLPDDKTAPVEKATHDVSVTPDEIANVINQFTLKHTTSWKLKNF